MSLMKLQLLTSCQAGKADTPPHRWSTRLMQALVSSKCLRCPPLNRRAVLPVDMGTPSGEQFSPQDHVGFTLSHHPPDVAPIQRLGRLPPSGPSKLAKTQVSKVNDAAI